MLFRYHGLIKDELCLLFLFIAPQAWSLEGHYPIGVEPRRFFIAPQVPGGPSRSLACARVSVRGLNGPVAAQRTAPTFVGSHRFVTPGWQLRDIKTNSSLKSPLPLLVGIRFQELFHSPCRGAFHLSLTVLVHYRSLRST